MMKITINPSATANTRNCDYSKVSLDKLRYSTMQHKADVKKAMGLFSNMLLDAGEAHDDHKLETMEEFHRCFLGGFRDTSWWDEHKKERHHLPDNMQDVTLVDILEYIADCTMAGIARTGKVNAINIDAKKLMLAFKNTCKMLEQATELKVTAEQKEV